MKIKPNKREGFTLIEILLASAIFALVAVSGVSALSAIGRSLIQTQDQRHLAEVARTTMEKIANELRSANSFGYNSNISNGNNIIIFHKNSDINLFKVVEDSSVNRLILNKMPIPPTATPNYLTPPDINVQEFKVIEPSPKAGNTSLKLRPYVRFKIKFETVNADQSGKTHSLELQTTITPRNWQKGY